MKVIHSAALAPQTILDARRLQTFVQLARTASFAAAAKALSITPSAMSHSVRTFEEELGTPLFHRRGHRAVLTAAGQRLLPRAERILHDMSSAYKEVQAAQAWGRGELRVCAPASICRYVLPPALCEFRESFPDCIVSVQASDTPGAHQQVQDGSADLAIGVESGESRSMNTDLLFKDEMFLYVNPHHPLAKRTRTQKWPTSGRFILYSLSSVSGRQTLERLRSEGVKPSQIMEIGSQEAILEMTRIGIGAAVISNWVARQDESRGLVQRVPGVAAMLERTWSAWWREGEDMPVTTQVMLGLIKDVCRDLNPGHSVAAG